MSIWKKIRRQDGRTLAHLGRRDAHPQGFGGRWTNPSSGLGGPLDRSQRDEYTIGFPVDQWLADALLTGNAVARRIAAREAEDCTREGYELTLLPPEVAQSVIHAVEGGEGHDGLDQLSIAGEARTWARAYGGGAMVLLVDDGRPQDQPIDRANIRAVRGLLSADRYELPVASWGSDPAEARTWGRPRTYRLNLNRGGGVAQSMVVHADRVVRFRGVPVPRRVMIQRQGWDGSIFDLVYPQLRAYGSTHAQVVEAVGLLNQGTLSSPALTDAAETEEGVAVFARRLEAMRMAMGLYGEMAVGEGEKYEIHNRSIAGMDAAVKAAVDALVAAADGMPRLVLLGEPTAGLSDTTGGELRMWYDVCSARQPRFYTPAVRAVTDLVMLSHEGPTGGRLLDYGVEWLPIGAVTDEVAAETALKRSQRRMIDVQAMIVSAEEARQDPDVQEYYDLDDQEQGDAPVEPGQEPGDQELAGQPIDETALNGAQIKSLLEIVQSVSLGELPADAARGIIGAAFPLLRGREAAVLGSAANQLPGPQPGPTEGLDDDQLATTQPSMEPPPSDLQSPRAAGQMFGVPTATISRLIATGRLPYWGLGSHRRVSAAAVAQLAKSHEEVDDG